MTNELEEECRSVTTCHSTHHQELEKIRDEIKVDFLDNNYYNIMLPSPFIPTASTIILFGHVEY